MLPGVVPFPPEFAGRYRAKGYWQDKTLAAEFSVVFEKYKNRTALVDGDRSFTYAEVDRLTDNLALNLLELGLRPLDRVVPALPNIAEFVLLYFALQKIGAIPIAALVTHRYAEISQFVQLSGATTCVYPERQGDFQFAPMVRRVQHESTTLKHCISLPALAQIPASQLPGVERQRFEELPPPRAQPGGAVIKLPSTVAPEGADDIALIVRDVTIVGATVYGRDQFVELYRDLIGQPVKLTVTSFPGSTFSGKVIFINSVVDPDSRTVKVRTEVANSDGRLKPDMFANVEIITDVSSSAISVPQSAVLEDDGKSVVFVSEGNAYQKRQVQTGIKTGDLIEIIDGLKAGEKVVVKGNYLLLQQGKGEQ